MPMLNCPVPAFIAVKVIESLVEQGWGDLSRVTFRKDRNDPCTWVLYLLVAEEISVGKAAEWLRDYIRDGKRAPLPEMLPGESS